MTSTPPWIAPEHPHARAGMRVAGKQPRYNIRHRKPEPPKGPGSTGEIVLWRCEPLAAQLTEAACTRNRVKAASDPKHLRMSQLEKCVGCPGVCALNRLPANVLDAATTAARAKAAHRQVGAVRGSPDGSPMYLQQRRNPRNPMHWQSW